MHSIPKKKKKERIQLKINDNLTKYNKRTSYHDDTGRSYISTELRPKRFIRSEILRLI